jgi:predicted acyltransferase
MNSNLPPTNVPSTASSRRLMSLDALRGFDMFWIIGANFFVTALGQMSSSPFLKGLATQLEHAEWEGFRFYDLIFPLFIFIVGVSLVFSLTRAIEREGKRAAYRRIFRRFILLYLIALLYSGGLSKPWPDLRLMGVLNRIALCYLVTALIFCHCNWKGMVAIGAGLLVGYWALMTFAPYPDVRPRTANGELVSVTLTATNTAQLNFGGTNRLKGIVGPGLNLANYLDQRYLPGRKWDGTWDPEGYLSTLPAIVTCLLGVFAGLLLHTKTVTDQRKVYWLLGAGVVGVAAGWLWGSHFPVIKKVWTSSYVLVAGGYSAILLGVFYQVIEIWMWQKWAHPFVWIGANAITAYLANNVIDFLRLARRFAGGDVKNFLDATFIPGCGDLFLAIVAVGLGLLLVNFLYRKRIFLRL